MYALKPARTGAKAAPYVPLWAKWEPRTISVSVMPSAVPPVGGGVAVGASVSAGGGVAVAAAVSVGFGVAVAAAVPVGFGVAVAAAVPVGFGVAVAAAVPVAVPVPSSSSPPPQATATRASSANDAEAATSSRSALHKLRMAQMPPVLPEAWRSAGASSPAHPGKQSTQSLPRKAVPVVRTLAEGDQLSFVLPYPLAVHELGPQKPHGLRDDVVICRDGRE